MTTRVTLPSAPVPNAGDLALPVSPGEFLDRLGILEIKAQRIPDAGRRTRVQRELLLLRRIWSRSPFSRADIAAQYGALKGVNEQLWDVEDRIRAKEASQCFDDEFVALARSVYILNDRRAACKRLLNRTLGSTLDEEKSYAPYDTSAEIPALRDAE